MQTALSRIRTRVMCPFSIILTIIILTTSIIKVDKGNATFCHKFDYDKKLANQIKDGCYCKLNRPILKIKKKDTNTEKKQGDLNNITYNWINTIVNSYICRAWLYSSTQMSITQELHCPRRTQSSGNIEQQHRMMKDALYILCEDRNCKWTEVLESVISSMNTTINSATGISPHYTITSRHPNISLPNLQGRYITIDNPGADGKQINALLRQVHHRVALANDEANYKLEASLDHLTNKDPIQVGDKVLLHQPKSTVAQSSHLPWVNWIDPHAE